MKAPCFGGSSEQRRMVSVRGRQRHRWSTASQLSVRELVFSDCVIGFGDGGEFVWDGGFHCFFFIWAALLSNREDGREDSWWFGPVNSMRRNLFAAARVLESVRFASDVLGPRDTSVDSGLKITVTDLCWAWTPPPVKSRSPITTLSVFTGGGASFP